jgi:hypothetical protein
LKKTEPIDGFYPRAARRGRTARSTPDAELASAAQARIDEITANGGARRDRDCAWSNSPALGRERAEQLGLGQHLHLLEKPRRAGCWHASERGCDSTIVRPAIVESARRFPASRLGGRRPHGGAAGADGAQRHARLAGAARFWRWRSCRSI